MKIAKVTGNIVATIRQDLLRGKSLKTVVLLDAELKPGREEHIALDVSECTVGDIVLVNTECNSARTFFGEEQLVSEMTICGIIDEVAVEGIVHTARDIRRNE